ncbi:MAG: type II toxin-antitoxin system RelE/ParE family toxin [archaeon]|nr:type II toxin-antitoxin system RelE/ParE family toxin [archaeon]
MSEWEIKEHPDFFKDLDKLDKKVLKIFYKKKQKIKENPERLKHLSGGSNCYREPITENIRLIYLIEGKTIWFLTIGKHKEAYKEYLKRLYSLRNINPKPQSVWL